MFLSLLSDGLSPSFTSQAATDPDQEDQTGHEGVCAQAKGQAGEAVGAKVESDFEAPQTCQALAINSPCLSSSLLSFHIFHCFP